MGIPQADDRISYLVAALRDARVFAFIS